MRIRHIDVWWIVGFLFVIILIAYIFNYNLFGIKTLYHNSISTIKGTTYEIKEKVNTGECPGGIVPEHIYLNKDLLGIYNYTEPYFGNYFSMLPWSYWADGSEMNLMDQDWGSLNRGYSLCHHGREVGENVSLIYCNNLSYSKSITPISEGGIVGKTESVSYKVNIIITKIGETAVLGKPYPPDNLPRLLGYIYDYNITSSECIKQ